MADPRSGFAAPRRGLAANSLAEPVPGRSLGMITRKEKPL